MELLLTETNYQLFIAFLLLKKNKQALFGANVLFVACL